MTSPKSSTSSRQPPFKRVLIANRGEIAIRVARTLREMGISPVTVCSDVDRTAPHVKACDAFVEIGPAPSRESYLKIDRVIAAAKALGAEAIHPGYGFLSENSLFAQACADAGLVFIGPPAKAIAAMGSKTAARQAMHAAGVPVVPGTMSDVSNDEELVKIGTGIGFPIMCKAVAGGGGKGMRLVREPAQLVEAVRSARSEAQSAFGDGRVYLERFVEQPRHTEIQIFCDSHGNGVYFGERDCSVQRRHQKVLEEAPSPVVTPEIRQRMGEVAVKGALSVGYVGAGTMEFLLDPKGNFYFLEMNTRLQVEHPVTEAVYGIDLVREQVRIAAGEKLGYAQADLQPRGHAIEARVYAEDAANNFMPSPGLIEHIHFPYTPNVRIDTGVETGFTVPIYYDPMIAKMIAWAPTREQAIDKLLCALSATEISGLTTNLTYLCALLDHPAFRNNDVDTGFVDKHKESLQPTAPSLGEAEALALAAALRHELDVGQTQMASVAIGNGASEAGVGQRSAWLEAGRFMQLGRGSFVR